jgi:hypothetical protein
MCARFDNVSTCEVYRNAFDAARYNTSFSMISIDTSERAAVSREARHAMSGGHGRCARRVIHWLPRLAAGADLGRS